MLKRYHQVMFNLTKQFNIMMQNKYFKQNIHISTISERASI